MRQCFAEMSDLFLFYLSMTAEKANLKKLDLFILEIFTICTKSILATDVSYAFFFDLIYKSTTVHSVCFLKLFFLLNSNYLFARF